MGDDKDFGFGLFGEFSINKIPFIFSYIASSPSTLRAHGGHTAKKKVMAGKWVNQDEHTLSLLSVGESFNQGNLKLEIPDVFDDWPFVLDSIGLSYNFGEHQLTLEIKVREYGALTISTGGGDVRTYAFGLELENAFFYLRRLPVIGSYLSGEDGVGIKTFDVEFKPGNYIKIGSLAKLVIQNNAYDLDISYQYDLPHKNYLFQEEEKKQSSVHWLNFQKELGFLSFHRIGFSLEGHKIYLYLDVSFFLSVITVDVLGLNIGIPMDKKESFSFGLQGLALSLSKPPLYLAGGLYISKDGDMQVYSGMIQIRCDKFGLAALGLYGQAPNGDTTLFIYGLISIPLGGPPYFYIKGLAGGFGFNREIILPSDVAKVREFPFVAIALGNETKLKKGDTPGEVLKKMQQQIIYKKSQYFVTVGVSFASFGVIESFILLNIQFGARFEASILGISSLALPPKVSPVNPIGYAELAVKAVLAPDDGEFSIMAALTSESYLFDKNCKLTGGFAAAFWWKGDYAGDFVITVGGYHPEFVNKHYPKIDRVGINWKIDDHLSLKGGAYFALTPSCIMAGGELSITYEWGKLKAWVYARADFLLQWKPFHYDIAIGASIGASYRVDFLFVHHTFTIELGADMHIWGPDFQGVVHIKWFIISFTITFGKQQGDYKQTIDWTEFHDSFLPQKEHKAALPGNDAGDEGLRLIDIKVTGGLLKELPEKKSNLVSAHYLSLEIHTGLPCTDVLVNNATKGAYTNGLGIVPMGIAGYTSCLNITLCREGETDGVPVEAEVVTGNIPSALWGTAKPDKNSGLIAGVPMGAVLSCPANSPEGILPPDGKLYKMRTLTQNEYLEIQGFQWTTPLPAEGKKYDEQQAFTILASTICAGSEVRKQLLDALSGVFSVRREHQNNIKRWAEHAGDILLARPVLKTTGDWHTETPQNREV